jgi:Family of unknown function (DUF5681)
MQLPGNASTNWRQRRKAMSTKEGNYEVGYRRPPRQTRFKKGRSGNPRGRPPGSRNFASLVDEALAEPVVINENGRRKKATKLQVIVKQMVNKAAQGDHRSIQLLMAFTERHQLTGRDGKPLTVVELLAAIGPISHED